VTLLHGSSDADPGSKTPAEPYPPVGAGHDEGSLMKLPRLAVAAVAAYVMAGRRWQLRWGADSREATARLPGDDLVADPDLVATRAITIQARPVDVWPWIAQLGQNRGGFYSYDMLENLAGCQIHSSDQIVPAWQDVTVGDAVHLAPEVALSVAEVDPPRALVLSGGVPMGETAPPYDFSWSFVLDGQDSATRLIVRERYAYTRAWAPLLVEPVAVISFLMSQKMLRSIRDRAERAGDHVRADA
jgi:hypothetical protein